MTSLPDIPLPSTIRSRYVDGINGLVDVFLKLFVLDQLDGAELHAGFVLRLLDSFFLDISGALASDGRTRLDGLSNR